MPLLEPLTVDVDACDAGYAQQVLTDLPVRDGRQLDQVELLGGDADLHDATGRRQGGHHPHGPAHVGMLGETWKNDPARSWRARASSVPFSKMSRIDDSWATDFECISSSPGQAVERLLDRHGDQGLDLGSRVAEGDGLDLHLRWSKLRKDVDLRLGTLGQRERHERGGEEDDDPAEVEASRHDPPHVSRPLTKARRRGSAGVPPSPPACRQADHRRARPCLRRRWRCRRPPGER